MIRRVPSPVHFITLAAAGWLNREVQLDVNDLRAENEVLREQLPALRRWLADAHRHRTAIAAKRLGRVKLVALGSLCKPDAILAWCR